MYYAIISVEKERRKIMDYSCLQPVTCGGSFSKRKSNSKITFFHNILEQDKIFCSF